MIITVTRQQRVPVIRSGKSHGYFWSMEWYDSQTPFEIMFRVYAPRILRQISNGRGVISHTTCYLEIPTTATARGAVCFYSVDVEVCRQRVPESGWLEAEHCTRVAAYSSCSVESSVYRTRHGASMPLVRGTEVPWSSVLESILPTAEYVCQQLRRREESGC